jgi:glycosyltransferase involved in cell wall biosynthesis
LSDPLRIEDHTQDDAAPRQAAGLAGILDTLAHMTVQEVMDLLLAMEDQLGVSATALVAPVLLAAPGGGGMLLRRCESFQAMLIAEGLVPRPDPRLRLALLEGRRDPLPKPRPLWEPAPIRIDEVMEDGGLEDFPERATCRRERDGVLLFLPRLPVALRIDRGGIGAVEIHDAVMLRYVAYPRDDAPPAIDPRPAARDDAPPTVARDSDPRHGARDDGSDPHWVRIAQQPCAAHGCVLRLRLPSPDLTVTPVYDRPRTVREIAAICFTVDPDEGRAPALDAEIQRRNGVRTALEQRLLATDLAIRRLETTRDRIEAERDRLEMGLEEWWLTAPERYAAEIHRREGQIAELQYSLALERDLVRLRPDHLFAPYRPKAVLVLSHMYPRKIQPAQGIFVHEQVKALRAAGIDARIASGEPFWLNFRSPLGVMRRLQEWRRINVNAWEEHDGVPMVRFPYLVGFPITFQCHAATYTKGLMDCANWLHDQFPFEVVHAHTSYTDGSAGAVLAARFRLPLLITEHTGPFRMLTRTPYLRRRTQAAINAATQFISVSAALLEDVAREVHLSRPERAMVLPNVVDTGHFQLQSRVPDGCIRAVWIGHFVPVKRVPDLIQAFALAKKTEPRLRLRLVGTGVGEAEARALVQCLDLETEVEFPGHADRRQLVGHLRDSDFLCVSSASETFGVVAIEAMSCGRPVLTTACGGPAETISHPGLGLVVEHSPEEMARGMLEMARRLPDFDPRFIRQVTEARFSSTAIAARLLDLYAEARFRAGLALGPARGEGPPPLPTGDPPTDPIQ